MDSSPAILALDTQFGMEHFMVYNVFEHVTGYRFPIEDWIYPDCICMPDVAPECPCLHKTSWALHTPGDETCEPASKILHVDSVIDIPDVMIGALNPDTCTSVMTSAKVFGHLAEKLPYKGGVTLPIPKKVRNFLDYLIPCPEKNPLESDIYPFPFQTKGENTRGIACEGEVNRFARDPLEVILERAFITNGGEIELDHGMSISKIESC